MAAAGTIEPDWDAARARVHGHGWAAAILAQVREDFRRWDGLIVPGPSERTEWTHHYFCDDGTPLRFDPALPRTHRCPTCGRTREGEPWDGAWRTKMHNLAASHAQRAALLARLDEDEEVRRAAVAALAGLLEHYATTYRDHPLHGDKVGKGRVMPQNLDESIWTIALLRAVRWAEPLLPARTLTRARTLAREVAAVLEPQIGEVHNIQCWVLAALAECAVRGEDPVLLERVRSGPFGIETQIREGFREEGIWYETSLFYHFYTLGALLSYREAAGVAGLDTADATVIARAIAAPAQLAYTDGLLPAYGDCWPHGHLDDFAGHAAAATALLPDCRVDAAPYADAGVRSRPVELWLGTRWDDGTSTDARHGIVSVAALVFGPPDDGESAGERGAGERSFLWPDAGIGVLRSDRARITARFGRDVGMHDHHDKLGVDVETAGGWRSLDLGSGGYTSAMTGWTRSASAHSIGIVHDRPQPAVDAELDAWTDRSVDAHVAWDSAAQHRSLALTADGWTDTMRLSCDDAGPLLWLLHGDGEVAAVSHPVDAAEIGAAPGSEWFEELRELTPDEDGRVTATWRAPGAPEVTVPLPPGARAFAATAPGNPSGRPLGILAIRHEETTEMTVAARAVVPAPDHPLP